MLSQQCNFLVLYSFRAYPYKIKTVYLSKLRSIRFFIFLTLLISLSAQNSYAQESDSIVKKPRIVKVENTLDGPAIYSCRDSIVANLKLKTISLYGEAEMEFQGIKLTADYLEMDMDRKEVFAIYTENEQGERVGIPKFQEGTESFTAATIRYNFETQKGYIEELRTKQEENYLYMGAAKRQKSGHVHFKDGRFTTCDLDYPHFHFQLSKAVLVPSERIVTGPMNLWVMGVPTPLGLPYSFIPTKERGETGGLLFPNFVPAGPFGFGFSDLGYYFPIKKTDKIHTTVYGSLFSQGTFAVRNLTEYKVKYKYMGSVNAEYNSFRRPFPQDSIRDQKIILQWTHQQEAKANPYWRFSSRVNFQSDNSGQTNLDPLNPQYFNNNFNSDINLMRSFPGKPVTMGLKIGMIQNSVSNNLSLDLPTYNVNVNRFFPFKALRKSKIGGEKWYEKIGFTYNMEAKNRARFVDTLLRDRQFDLIQQQFQNGIRHSAAMITAFQLFNQTITLSPTVNYNMRQNFQFIERGYDALNNAQTIDTLRGMGISQDLSFALNFSTTLYAYYRFAWDKDMRMRHVMTPRVNFRWIPNLSSFVTENVGTGGAPLTYSPFERSLYTEPNGRALGLIDYGLTNTFELKTRARRDTLNEFNKFMIIDALSISGNYDVLKDTMRLSNPILEMRMSPFPALSFVSRGNFSPYAYDTTGIELNQYAWNNNQGLGRFLNFDFSTTFTITSKESKEVMKENQQSVANAAWGADFQYFVMNPHDILDFRIPWKVNITHTWFFNRNSNPVTFSEKRYIQNQNVMVSGDISFTERWKLGFNANYDVADLKITQTRMSLTRNMHCWQLSFFWNSFGEMQNFMVRLNANAAMLQNAKLEFRKPPDFL
jgi:hypothetical protein